MNKESFSWDYSPSLKYKMGTQMLSKYGTATFMFFSTRTGAKADFQGRLRSGRRIPAEFKRSGFFQRRN